MSPALAGTLVGLGLLFLGCIVLAAAAHAHRKQLATHDAELAQAIGVGQGKDTTHWIELWRSGRHEA